MSNMTINGGSALANTHGIESSEHANLPGRTTNFVNSQVAEQYATNQMQHSENKPTDGSRECTEPKGPSWEDIQSSLNEALSRNEEYQSLNKELALLDQMSKDTQTLLQSGSIGWDQTLTMGEIYDVASGNFPADMKAAAKRLLDNPELLDKLKNGDDKYTSNDIGRLRKEFDDRRTAIRQSTEDQVRADLGAAARVNTEPATGSGAPAGTSGSGSVDGGTPAPGTGAPGQDILAEAGKPLPKPPPSQQSGLEGASENINNMIGWGEQEIDRLTTLMGKTDDPATLKQLENKINQMSRRMQQMSAMLQQIMTMMTNLSKMYSDIAMNSVRNIK